MERGAQHRLDHVIDVSGVGDARAIIDQRDPAFGQGRQRDDGVRSAIRPIDRAEPQDGERQSAGRGHFGQCAFAIALVVGVRPWPQLGILEILGNHLGGVAAIAGDGAEVDELLDPRQPRGARQFAGALDGDLALIGERTVHPVGAVEHDVRALEFACQQGFVEQRAEHDLGPRRSSARGPAARAGRPAHQRADPRAALADQHLDQPPTDEPAAAGDEHGLACQRGHAPVAILRAPGSTGQSHGKSIGTARS